MMTAYEGSGTGIDVSVAQQIEYNTWFAGEVHAAGMSVGLKNAVEMVKDVVDYFDFVLNESCHVHKICSVRFSQHSGYSAILIWKQTIDDRALE